MNIAEILRSCAPGAKLYCTLCGECTLYDITDTDMIIVLDKCNRRIELCNDGSWRGYTDSECILFPARTQRDWNKFRLIPQDTPVLVSVDGNEWMLRFYYGNDKVYINGCNSKKLDTLRSNAVSSFNYIVPAVKFDFSPEAINNRTNINKSII